MKSKRFSIFNRPMICAQSDVFERKFKKIIGKRGIWYVALQENEADNVYFTANDGKYSNGFSGAEITFELEDGAQDQIQGPWHSNSDALFNDTGYDIRNKCYTQGIIAKQIIHNYYKGDLFREILHYDKKAVLGEYHRIENLAQKFANELNCKVYFSFISSGGGSSFHKLPEEKIDK
jgi:hypothetical protein